MRKTSALVAAAVVSLSISAGITQPAFAGDCLSTPVTYTPKPDISKFKQRIQHIKDQTSNAETKGWIDASTASNFKTEADKLSSQEKSTGPKASKDKMDSLEKEVTRVHHELHQAIARGQKDTAEG